MLNRCLVIVLAVACSGRPERAPADAADAATSAADAGSAKPMSNEPYVILYPPGGAPVQVKVELAIAPEERSRGLMHRKQMAPDAGMLFLFPGEEIQSFWMKNTLLSLDMIFIRSDLTVAGVVPDTEPLSLQGRSVNVPSQYVLETNAGWAASHGVAAGTPVKFVNVPPAPAE